MPPDVQVDPDALRTAAAAAATIADAIPLACLGDAEITTCHHVEGGPELVAEHDRILAVLRAAAQELAELALAAVEAACLCESADRHACRLIQRADGDLG